MPATDTGYALWCSWTLPRSRFLDAPDLEPDLLRDLSRGLSRLPPNLGDA
jgi:hypothetical protein